MASSKHTGKHHPTSGRVRKSVQNNVPSVPVGSEAPLSRLKDHESFLSASSFRSPEKILPSGWHEHAPFAFWLVEKLRPRVLVELGTHNGFSYFAFCQAIRMAGLSAAAFAVDHWTGDEHAGFYGEDVYQSVEAYNGDRYSDISTLLKMAFAEALHYFEDGSVDLLHIDGRHHFDDVKTDFESWLPKLSDRAVVLFHDTNVREREFGVHRLWAEVCGQYPNFNFFHGHGLGVLGVGKTCPSPVAALFTASADENLTASIRNAYARLGGAVTLAFRASEASQLWASAAREAGALGTEREALRQRIAELSDDQSRLQTEAEVTAAELKDELDRAFTLLSAERQRCAERTDELAGLEERHRLAEAALTARVDEAKRALDEAARDKDAFSQTFAASLTERDSLQADNERIAAELLSQQQEIIKQAAAAAELVVRVDQAETALDNALRSKKSLSQNLADAVAERNTLQADNARIAAELLSQQQEIIKQAAAAAELAARIDQAEKAFEEATRDKESLSQNLAASVGECDALKADNARIAAELLSQQQEIIKQAAAAAELAARIDQAEKALEEAARDKFLLSRDLAASVAQLADTQLNLGEIAHKHAEALEALELARVEKATIEAARVDLAASLDRALNEKHALAADLDLMSSEWQCMQRASTDRASTQEAAHARTLTETQKVHEAQIRALRGRLVDAEAARSYSNVKRLHDGVWAKISPARFWRHRQGRRLIQSGLFDISWYIAEYPDVEQSGLDAADHYLEIGFCRGYKPNPFFDTRWYLERYDDVLISGMNPLLHYLTNGFLEGRDPGPDFQTDFYLETNPDVRSTGTNPLAHYLRYGRHEGRLPVRPA